VNPKLTGDSQILSRTLPMMKEEEKKRKIKKYVVLADEESEMAPIPRL